MERILGMKIIKIFPIILIIIFLSSCVSKVSIRRINANSLDTTSIQKNYRKNYNIGQMQTAFVGESIIRAKEVTVTTYRETHMGWKPTDNFTMQGSGVTISGYKDTSYPIKGDTYLDGKLFSILHLKGNPLPFYKVLIDEDGNVYHKAINREVVMVWDFKLQPPNVKFLKDYSQKEYDEETPGNINYELIYGGTDGKTIKITYREYTSEDMARQAFYQDLVFDANSDYIRFKKNRIKVHEVTNEKIVYIVTEDGLN